MRTVAAFLATVLIAVPAAWHALDADIQTDGPATRPKQETLEVDGARVTVELDRGLLMAGGTLKATLVATSETPKKISLDVRAMEDMGYGEERVQNPPLQVGRRKITIEATPQGTSTEVAFKLGSRGKKGVVNWYDIEVSRAGKPMGVVADDGEPSSARVGAATWSGNTFALAIEPPAVIPVEQNFTVAVRVTNTTKKPLDWLEIDLGGASLGYGDLGGSLYLNTPEGAGFTVERSAETFDSDEALKPGESRVVHYDIIPVAVDGPKTYTLTAHAHGSGGGALEIVTLKATPAPDQPAPAVANTCKPDGGGARCNAERVAKVN